MDKSFWAKIEERLRGYYSLVKLKIGDDIITLNLQRHKMKLYIAVYVNGTINFEEEETQKQYWYENTRYFLSGVKRKKYAEKIIKHFGKRKGTAILKEDHELYNAKLTLNSPYFPSVKTLKSQYNKRFEKIELLDCDEDVIL